MHLAYLLLRENLINRLFHQRSGYWQNGLQGLDALTDADHGAALVDYLGLSDEQIATAANRMINESGGTPGDDRGPATYATKVDLARAAAPADGELSAGAVLAPRGSACWLFHRTHPPGQQRTLTSARSAARKVVDKLPVEVGALA